MLLPMYFLIDVWRARRKEYATMKLWAYGFLRVCYPIFPQAGIWAAEGVAILGVINIIYGAFCCLAQSDFKRLVAYSSISHMGYVVLGIAIMTTTGFQGAMFQIL